MAHFYSAPRSLASTAIASGGSAGRSYGNWRLALALIGNLAVWALVLILVRLLF